MEVVAAAIGFMTFSQHSSVSTLSISKREANNFEYTFFHKWNPISVKSVKLRPTKKCAVKNLNFSSV